EDGTAYSTYAPNDAGTGNYITGYDFTQGLSVANAPSFVTASLTGTKNVIGDELIYAPNGLCESGNGKSGLDSAIAYQWHKLTGEKTWIVNAAHSGTSIISWDPEGSENNEFYQASEVIKYAKQTAVKEYNAGHYNIKHIAYIWVQGESDNTMSADEYIERYEALHPAFKQAMTMTLGNNEVTAEYGAMISTRKCIDYPMYTYNDIPLNGQRVAHYYLANEKKYPDIVMVSNIGDDWVQTSSERETGKLQAYFEEHYPNGELDYPTQCGIPNTIPANCKEIHYGAHYSQVGYNEVGFDSTTNLAKMFGYISDDNESEIKLLKQNGYEEHGDVINYAPGTEFTAVPVLKSLADTSKAEFFVELSDGITEVSPYKYKVNANSTITYHLPGGKTYVVTVNAVDYGDLNDDGRVNLLDLVLMRKYLAKWNVTINEEAADLMHNGKINLVDLTYLRKLLVHIPVEVGPKYVS
ncbi:MAG: dockerin type I domain-containing protein, partial [Acutalibacteraceae bacterium]